MTSRKRSASITLQPVHHTKQPRIRHTRPDGTSSSPSDSIGDRWKSTTIELYNLSKETLTCGVNALYSVIIMPFSTTTPNESESPVQAQLPSPSPSRSPTPDNVQAVAANASPSTPKRTKLKDPPNQSTPHAKPLAEDISLQLENLAFTPPSKCQPSSQSPDAVIVVTSTPIASSSQPASQQSSITSLPFTSAESSQTTASSPSSQPGQALSTKSVGRKSTSTPRKDTRSRHILHNRHKAAVKAEREHFRKSLVRELFAVKKEQGYGGSEQDLDSFLTYRRLLQNIKRGQRLSPLFDGLLPSSHSLKVPFAPPDAKRLLDEEEEEEEQFLYRALARAKSTLNSPKPIKPYIPAIEELEVRRHKKGKELESRAAVPSIPSTLAPDDEQMVKGFLQRRGVISKFAREQVSDTDIRRLGPGQWLNDELINFYGALIMDRAEVLFKETKSKGGKGLDVHYFSTFFWSKLVNEGYEKGRLAKWTKKIDIFAKDLILIPVNHNNTHWTAAAINFRLKRLESYDSMAYLDENVFRVLRVYLEAESINKKKKAFDWEGWTNWAPKTTPQQENGFDCGVFTCQILRAVSRGDQAFAFSQKDMPYLRRRMIWEIGHAKLRDGYS